MNFDLPALTWYIHIRMLLLLFILRIGCAFISQHHSGRGWLLVCIRIMSRACDSQVNCSGMRQGLLDTWAELTGLRGTATNFCCHWQQNIPTVQLWFNYIEPYSTLFILNFIESVRAIEVTCVELE